jgi:putative transcriptional regulator
MAGESPYLKGRLILDGGNLAGSFFHRTVVLICSHDKEGAFGLVLNRDTGDTVEDVLAEDVPEQICEQHVFIGGPVQPGALSYLHSDEYLPEANVLPGLNVGHSLEDLLALGDNYSKTLRLRVFAGYSGWSPGQLEDEMKRDSWLVHPATIDLVFNTDPAELWKKVVSQMGPQYRILSDAPDDLSWN